ncbi:MAG: NAD(P)H-dependent oxidoreductase subunit E [Deltaproteobacteria bacterium]|nr:NAD(P)H-dependent oxidoreductase subunit E [Deltaproteobacteria bacterium]MBW2216125.1 NAD(P)H-dependent oxidoreductase subunit E [Deltaproteobacteria bacterium]
MDTVDLDIDLDKVDQIVDTYNADEGSLIQILLDVQKQYNWLPPEAVRRVSDRLDMPITQVYRVASFYKVLSITPRGKHIVKACLGTACHVRGGTKVMKKIGRTLGIATGEVTDDMQFSLEVVNCLGCCALGPMITIDDEYHGKMTPEKATEVIKNI